MAPPLAPDLDALTTPLAWAGVDGAIAGGNQSFSRWLGVSARRLVGWPLAELDGGDGRLAAALSRMEPDSAPLRIRRVRLQYPDAAERFADLWLTAMDEGWLLEAHPVDEFPGDDPALLLPAALSASLKGLAHELRNPLAGLKGAAQLLARRADGEGRELTGLIEDEVERLAALVDRLLSPAPPRPFELRSQEA